MDELFNEFLKDVLSLLSKSPLAILCVLMCYAQGILILNAIASLKRKKRKNIYQQPLLAISIGFAFPLIIIIFKNFDSIKSYTFTFETFLSQIFVDEIITLPIIVIVSIVIYTIKEIQFMKDGGNNE